MKHRLVVLGIIWIVGFGTTVGSAQPGDGQGVDWVPYPEAIQQAQEEDRHLLIHVYAPWCGWCHKMDEEVYTDPAVRQTVGKHFVATRLNFDGTVRQYPHNGRRISARSLAQKFRVRDVPGTIILSPQGDYLVHLTGYIEVSRLDRFLETIGRDQFHR